MLSHERRAVDLCRLAQDLVPGYADEWLEPADLFLLTARLAVTVVEEEDLLLPAAPVFGDDARRLVLRAGLPEALRRFLILRQVGHRIAPYDVAPVVPVVFALCGVLNHADVTGPEGARVLRERVEEICSEAVLWTRVSFPYILGLTEQVRRAVVWTGPTPPDPEEARRAYEEGMAARRASDYARAGERFRTAARIARGCRDWELLARTQLAVAKTAEQRGNFPMARRRFRQALDTARHYGVEVVEGMILHDLFILAVDTGQRKQAAEHAEEAVALYIHTRHPDLPRLAHDVGRFWITIGDYRSALAVVGEVLSHITRREEVMLVWGNVARAAAGMGEAELFERARLEVEGHAAASVSEEHLARGLLEVAIGAANLGLWERAESDAMRALEVAIRRSEAGVRFEVETLLANIRARTTGEASQTSPSRRRCALTQEIVEGLRERRSPGWEPVRD